MKKLLLFLMLAPMIGLAQIPFPVNQNVGSATSKQNHFGGIEADVAFIPPRYTDTTAANTNPYAKFYQADFIFTTSDEQLWVRNTNATKWLKVMGAGDFTEIYLGTVTNFSAGDLSTLFTTTEATTTTTPALSFNMANAPPYSFLGRASGTGAYSWQQGMDSNWIPTLHSQAYYNTIYQLKLSLTTNNNSGASTLSGAGVLNIPQYLSNLAVGTRGLSALPITNSNGTGFSIPLFSSTEAGIVSGSGGGTTNYLRADGTWAPVPSGNIQSNLALGTRTSTTMPITNTDGTGVTLPLFNTNAGLVPGTSSSTVLYLRADGTWATPPDLNTQDGANVQSNLGTGTRTASAYPITNSDGTGVTLLNFNTNSGMVPGTASNTTQYLRADGTWVVPPDNDTNTPTNLSLGTVTTTTQPILNSNGTGFTLPVVGTNAGLVPGVASNTALWFRGDKTWASLPSSVTNLALGTATTGTQPITNSNGTGFTLPQFTTTAGLVPGTASSTTLYLRADGTWQVPPGGSGNIQSNLSLGTLTTTTVPILNSDGTGVTLPVVGTLAGVVPGVASNTGLWFRGDKTWAALPVDVTNLALGTATVSTQPITNSNGTGFTLPQFSTTAGLVPGTATGTTLYLRQDGTWVAPPGTNVPANLALGTATTTTQPITNSNGTGFTLPVVTTTAGLVPGTASNTTQFLRADKTWAVPPDLGNIQSNLALGTRTSTTMPITNSDGTGVTLPVFNTNAGLVPGTASNTTQFLRADGTFAVPPDNVGTETTFGTVTNFSAGDLSPLFTTTEATTTTTPALSFALSNTTQYTVFGRHAGTGAPSWQALDPYVSRYQVNDTTWALVHWSGAEDLQTYTGIFGGSGGGGGTYTANNGLTMLTNNTQLGGPLVKNTYITANYHLAQQDGTFSVGTGSILGDAQLTSLKDDLGMGIYSSKTGFPVAGENSIAVMGGRTVGGGTYSHNGIVLGLYGELGFNSGDFTFSGSAYYISLGGINGVTTMYTGAGNLTAGNTMFSGGTYNANVSGTGNIDKFASIRALNPIQTPGAAAYTGTIANHYGVFIDNTLKNAFSITNRYGIYQEGPSDLNMFKGPIQADGLPATTGSYLSVVRNVATGRLELATIAGADGANVQSNLSLGTRTSTTMPILNSDGTGVTLPVFNTNAGLVPGTATGTTLYLRQDGTWVQPPGTATSNIQSNLALGTATTTTLPITNSDGTGFTLPVVTTTAGLVPGVASNTGLWFRGDKTWAALPAGDGANVQSNLSAGTRTSTTFPILNSDGTGVTVPVFTGTLAGLVPGTSAGSTTTFLRGDGTFATPAFTNQTITLSGAVTGSGTTAITTTLAGDIVTNANLANMPANTIKINNTGGVADPIDGTPTQTTAMLDVFTSALKGLAPASGGGTTNYLRADGTWAAPPGSGGSSKWTDVGSGNIYRNSKVQVGATSDPTALLQVTGGTGTATDEMFTVKADGGFGNQPLFKVLRDGTTTFGITSGGSLMSLNPNGTVNVPGTIVAGALSINTAYINTVLGNAWFNSGIAFNAPGLTYTASTNGSDIITAHKFTTHALLGTGGQLIADFQNFGTSKMSLDKDGILNINGQIYLNGNRLIQQGPSSIVIANGGHDYYTFSIDNSYINSQSNENFLLESYNGNDFMTLNSTGMSLMSLDTDGTAPSQTGTVRMVTTDGTGKLSFQAIPSGGGGGGTLQEVMDAGSTLTSNEAVSLGGNTFSFLKTSGSSSALLVQNTGTNGLGMYVESYTGTGMLMNTYGTNLSLDLELDGNTNNTIIPMISLQRSVSGTGANGIGTSIDYYLETSNGTIGRSNQLISKFTNATAGSQTSQLDITGHNNGTPDVLLASFKGNRQLQLPGYGVANFASAAAYALGVDASGNVIEFTPSGGGGGGDMYKADNLSGLTNLPTARTNLGGTTVGQNIFTSTNPSSIAFLKVNGDNSVTWRQASDFRLDIGAEASLGNPSTNGYVLASTTGGTRSWVALSGGGGGVTTMGDIAGSGTAQGASITGNNLYLHPATGTTGGVLAVGTQTLPSGTKIFKGKVEIDGDFYGDQLQIKGLNGLRMGFGTDNIMSFYNGVGGIAGYAGLGLTTYNGTALTLGSSSYGNAINLPGTNNTVQIPSLDTDATAPSQSGTTHMVTVDNTGTLSRQAIPSGGGGLTAVANTGTGAGVYKDVTSTTANLKGIRAINETGLTDGDAGITVTANTNSVDLRNSGYENYNRVNVSTVGAQQTVVFSYPVTNSVVQAGTIEFTATAMDDLGNTYFHLGIAHYKWNGSTFTIQEIYKTQEGGDAAIAASGVTIGPFNNTIRVLMLGVTGKTLNWTTVYKHNKAVIAQ